MVLCEWWSFQQEDDTSTMGAVALVNLKRYRGSHASVELPKLSTHSHFINNNNSTSTLSYTKRQPPDCPHLLAAYASRLITATLRPFQTIKTHQKVKPLHFRHPILNPPRRRREHHHESTRLSTALESSPHTSREPIRRHWKFEMAIGCGCANFAAD